jgi:hypothetical protein
MTSSNAPEEALRSEENAVVTMKLCNEQAQRVLGELRIKYPAHCSLLHRLHCQLVYLDTRIERCKTRAYRLAGAVQADLSAVKPRSEVEDR